MAWCAPGAGAGRYPRSAPSVAGRRDGVGAGGGRYEAEQIVFEPIANEQILLVARPGLVTQQLKDSRDLLELPLIQREPGSGTRQVVDAALVQAGITLSALRVVAQLGSSEAVRRAVLSGAGCGFVSSLAVERELAAGALQALTVPGWPSGSSFILPPGAVRRSRRRLQRP
ncbi:MAG: LysR substrate-binding domain-containing protein [Desulfobacterales bacterium]|nr:LysR substrate-binding domain-containing protein [Desulfobacterales bacterium]